MTDKKLLEDKQRRAEASRQFEDILVDEYEALFGHADCPPARYTIDPDDILDLQRLAEYLYEAGVKDAYSSYLLSIGTDGPRFALRAKIWNALPEHLQRSLETIATRGPGTQAADETRVALELSIGLNMIVEGKRVTEETFVEAAQMFRESGGSSLPPERPDSPSSPSSPA
jgi:hypothetical protein